MVKKKQKKLKMKPPEGMYETDIYNKLEVKRDGFEPRENTLQEDIELISPDELFGDTGGDSQTNPSKELFNPKNPKIKSELTDEEILKISRLYEKSRKYYEPRGVYMLRNVLNELILLRISKDRKSRTEFVETNREAMKNKDNGLLSRIIGGNNNL